MVSVDISNIWGTASLPDLLAIEKEIFAAHQMLEEASGEGNDLLGWRFLADDPESEEIQRIQRTAERIRESCDVFVVVGIGSAALGSCAAIDLLCGKNHNLLRRPQVFFAGNNLSTAAWNELCELLEDKDFCLNIVSDSGTATETAIATRALRWLCERRYGAQKAKERIFITVEQENEVLCKIAKQEGFETFVIPKGVGRYSVLSAVGLLPMAVAGIDLFELLSGAHDARIDMDIRSFDNPAWQYAASRNLMYRADKGIELLCSFEPDFTGFGHWWQQLFSQSEGKKGKGLFPVCVEFPADIYTLGQMIQQGKRNVFETVVRFEPPEKKTALEMDWQDLDGLNYLEGRTLDFVQEQSYGGALAAHTNEGVPVVLIEPGKINAGMIGELFYFFELSCAVSAYTLGVNPFDRPGTEMYVQNMQHLLGKPGC